MEVFEMDQEIRRRNEYKSKKIRERATKDRDFFF